MFGNFPEWIFSLYTTYVVMPITLRLFILGQFPTSNLTFTDLSIAPNPATVKSEQ